MFVYGGGRAMLVYGGVVLGFIIFSFYSVKVLFGIF